MKLSRRIGWSLFLLGVILTCYPTKASAAQSIAVKLPLVFEPNQGQAAPDVRYLLRGGAVEDDAEKRKNRKHRREWQRQGRRHQQRGCRFGDDHAPHDTQVLAEPAACRLAERSPDEEQGQAEANQAPVPPRLCNRNGRNRR